jgi:hypothetical protein
MRVLELGTGVLPAYAGMILAEQGHHVVKWTHGKDPVLDLNHGRELWSWSVTGRGSGPIRLNALTW